MYPSQSVFSAKATDPMISLALVFTSHKDSDNYFILGHVLPIGRDSVLFLNYFSMIPILYFSFDASVTCKILIWMLFWYASLILIFVILLSKIIPYAAAGTSVNTQRSETWILLKTWCVIWHCYHVSICLTWLKFALTAQVYCQETDCGWFYSVLFFFFFFLPLQLFYSVCYFIHFQPVKVTLKWNTFVLLWFSMKCLSK